MDTLLGFLGGVVGRLFSDAVLKWVALKALLVALFTTVVPLILNNFLYDFIEIVMGFASGQAGGASSFSGAMSFSGFCGWLINCFKIPEVLAVLVAAFVLRICLNMIPFVRL